ncbi:MAG TPA: serine hydrolase [Candidatus Saccharimonadales bacterium]|nr:serine hydrolase [Candidatus Saccharimonadales bacterium]
MSSYYPSTPSMPPAPSRRRRSRQLGRYLWLIGLIVLAVLSIHLLHSRGKSSAAPRPAQTAAQRRRALAALNTQINGILAANPGVDISVTVTDIHSDQSQSYGPAVPYEAASVAKLITAADYLHQVEAGTQSLQTELEDGNTAAYDLKQMIVVSDNNAWQSLTDQLTLDSLGNYAASIGINDYDLNDNTLQTSDIALLLQKLYTHQLLNTANTNLLLGYMKIANEAGFIVPAVPKDVTVYHKAGILDDRIHDAAIIADPVTPLALVIFTNGHGAGNDAARTAAIQSITKDVLAAYDIK